MKKHFWSFCHIRLNNDFWSHFAKILYLIIFRAFLTKSVKLWFLGHLAKIAQIKRFWVIFDKNGDLMDFRSIWPKSLKLGFLSHFAEIAQSRIFDSFRQNSSIMIFGSFRQNCYNFFIFSKYIQKLFSNDSRKFSRIIKKWFK